MIEHTLNYLALATPFMIYLILFLFPFIKSIYPPLPSDLIVLIGGTYITIGKISFVTALLLTSISSELGFLLLFYLGWRMDSKSFSSKKFRFISTESLHSAENWFAKYGYLLILINRFIIVVRSVVAFFAGISKLDIKKTIMFSSISSFFWHLLLLSLGALFVEHIKYIDKILSAYGKIILAIVLLIVIWLVTKNKLKKRLKD
jgi:membrane protein DedA with SNARE-associated domain